MTTREQSLAINDLINDGLATKRDIKELELTIKQLETSTNMRINEMGYKITVRLGSMIVGAVAVLSLLMKLFSLH